MKKILFILVVIISCTLFSCTSSMNFRYKDSDKYQIGEASFEASTVKKIKIEWAGTDTIIQSYDGEVIHIYEDLDEGTTEKYQLHYYLNNDTLYVEPCESLLFPQFNFKLKVLHVELPNTMDISNLELFDLELVSTKGSVNGVKADKIDIDSVSGAITLNNLTANNIDIDSVSGTVSINTVNSDVLDVEAVSGSITLTNINAKTDVEAVSGEITININSDSSFQIKLETTSGEIENEFDSLNQGDNPVTFKIKTVSGNVKIHKIIIGG